MIITRERIQTALSYSKTLPLCSPKTNAILTNLILRDLVFAKEEDGEDFLIELSKYVERQVGIAEFKEWTDPKGNQRSNLFAVWKRILKKGREIATQKVGSKKPELLKETFHEVLKTIGQDSFGRGSQGSSAKP